GRDQQGPGAPRPRRVAAMQAGTATLTVSAAIAGLQLAAGLTSQQRLLGGAEPSLGVFRRPWAAAEACPQGQRVEALYGQQQSQCEPGVGPEARAQLDLRQASDLDQADQRANG